MAAKIGVKSITVTRAEGLVEECDKPVTVKTYAEASCVLARWARTAPDSGGYDKCDFTVVFEDGEEYKGRADIQRQHTSGYSLGQHMRDFLGFYAGLYRPAHMSEERYRAFLAREENRSRIDEFKSFLEKYDLGEV